MNTPPTDSQQRDLFDLEFDLEAGRQARDAAIQLLQNNSASWHWAARAMVDKLLPSGWEGRGEEIRARLLDAGLPHPHSSNCWGALLLWCVKAHRLTPTGEHQHMQDPRSHARSTKVYRKI